MIQSLPEEHSHAMMLKHSTTKHLLPPLSQHSAMGPLLLFQGRGGGTQVCRSRRETDSWAGDLICKITQFIQLLKLHLQNCNVNDVPRRFLLKVTSSLCEREQMSSTSSIEDHGYETDLEGKTQVMSLMERQMCSVSDSCSDRACDQHGSPAPAVSERSPHLSVTCWTLYLFRPTTCPLDPGSRALMTCLPAQYLFFTLLPLTDSRSWLLYVSPTWLTPLALVGSPPDSVKVSWSSLPCWPTLVVSDPSAWLSWSSLCSVFCLNHPIVSMSYFTLCGTRWHLFNLYTCPTHLMVIISKSLALHLLFI